VRAIIISFVCNGLIIEHGLQPWDPEKQLFLQRPKIPGHCVDCVEKECSLISFFFKSRFQF
jgi:hypothetical protein